MSNRQSKVYKLARGAGISDRIATSFWKELRKFKSIYYKNIWAADALVDFTHSLGGFIH